MIYKTSFTDETFEQHRERMYFSVALKLNEPTLCTSPVKGYIFGEVQENGAISTNGR
jgi:hypothetical protein